MKFMIEKSEIQYNASLYNNLKEEILIGADKKIFLMFQHRIFLVYFLNAPSVV